MRKLYEQPSNLFQVIINNVLLLYLIVHNINRGLRFELYTAK